MVKGGTPLTPWRNLHQCKIPLCFVCDPEGRIDDPCRHRTRPANSWEQTKDARDHRTEKLSTDKADFQVLKVLS